MTVADFHPEDLLDLARRNQLSEDQRRRLEEHLAQCAVCAFELAAAEDFAREGAPRPGDDVLLARITEAALEGAGPGTSATVTRLAARAGSSAQRWPLGIAAGFALVALVGGTAAAAWLVVKALGPEAENAEVPAAPRAKRMRAAPPVVPIVPAIVDAAVPDAEPELSDAGAVAVDDVTVDDAGAQPRRGANPRRDSPSASALLERADAARRAGKLREAERAYRTLQTRYPDSREHDVSRVSLGRLLLDRRGQGRAALREFDVYLAKLPSGTLAEEARVGRALAAQHMGNGTRERAAWLDLLSRHPQSAYAAKAKARLSELEK
jgi:TolA-binding protein